jgi:hypothetical protein
MHSAIRAQCGCLLLRVGKVLVLLSLLPTAKAAAQYEVGSRRQHSTVQWGASLKASLELLRGLPNFRLAAVAGLGAPVFDRVAYPSLHLEGQLYGGGLGTHTGQGLKNYHATADFILAASVTSGVAYRVRRLTDDQLARRYQPLYYFTELALPPLQNPYAASVSVGTNFLLATDVHKSRWQQIGFFGIHGEWRHRGQYWGGQFNYYNDGGGTQALGIGDGRDRYYTGGGLLAFNAPVTQKLNTFTASYHKFSGFYPNAFELASALNLGYVPYRDSAQEHYNRSYYNFSVGSVSQGAEAFARINNPFNRFDFQNSIHYVGNFAYHQIHYPRHWSVGAAYYNSRVHFGNQ